MLGCGQGCLLLVTAGIAVGGLCRLCRSLILHGTGGRGVDVLPRLLLGLHVGDQLLRQLAVGRQAGTGGGGVSDDDGLPPTPQMLSLLHI